VPRTVVEETERQFRLHKARQREHLRMHGHAREAVHFTSNGRKMVVVGSEVHYPAPGRMFEGWTAFLREHASVPAWMASSMLDRTEMSPGSRPSRTTSTQSRTMPRFKGACWSASAIPTVSGRSVRAVRDRNLRARRVLGGVRGRERQHQEAPRACCHPQRDGSAGRY
jgi:hypothetical protein